MSDKQNTFKLKPFVCDHCLVVMAFRCGDALIAHGFKVELKKSHNIWCSDCHRPTKFLIAKKLRSVVSLP